MKEDLKRILYMGLGLMSETGEKVEGLKDELMKKGEDLYNKGLIANEELKHNIKEKFDDKKEVTKESLLKDIDNLSDKDKEDLIKELTKKKN